MESGCLGGLLRCVRLFCAGDCVGGLYGADAAGRIPGWVYIIFRKL